KDLRDPNNPSRILRKEGEQLSGFGELRDDGSTIAGCWLYTGSWTEEGNMMARRDNSDPTGIGQTLKWAWSWPANRRVMYNRASCDLAGKPFNPRKMLIEWDGQSWVGADTPDYKLDENPAEGMGPFIMNPEGVGRFFARKAMAEGPFPVHYEPVENPLGYNPLYPDNDKAVSNPIARIFADDLEAMGTVADFPYVATTYRLTEHFHFWTKHARLNAITQPAPFIEMGTKLAEKLGIKNGETVKISSKRGYVKAVAVVTKRIRELQIDGKSVHQVGIPLHWGFVGLVKQGYLTNTLTPSVGDGNTQTPEYKAFLVNVEKA
ncbi:MAG TPA: molybdopterin dinucleotide binding domain-containing protein, partial [Burkholderiaceae bacterium]|nr:molybdopterin dinucleotide binding domain-containing protein [Burkholderiaceae bacterium]